MIVIPAILSDSLPEIQERISLYQGLAGRVHLDLIDDPSLGNKTCSLDELLVAGVFANSMHKQIHLMVTDVSQYLETLNTSNPIDNLTVLVPTGQYAENQYSFSLGVSIGPDDDITDELLTADVLQIMTVYPGSQGNEFLPERLIMIDELRTMGYAGPIQLDGGIDDETIRRVLGRELLPDALCVGHYLNEEPEARLKALQELT
jgi:pentose-5-phosphate-3-epimerase